MIPNTFDVNNLIPKIRELTRKGIHPDQLAIIYNGGGWEILQLDNALAVHTVNAMYDYIEGNLMGVKIYSPKIVPYDNPVLRRWGGLFDNDTPLREGVAPRAYVRSLEPMPREYVFDSIIYKDHIEAMLKTQEELISKLLKPKEEKPKDLKEFILSGGEKDRE